MNNSYWRKSMLSHSIDHHLEKSEVQTIKALGPILKKVRIDSRVSQVYTANLIGLSQPVYSKIESSEINIPPQKLKIFSQFFNLSLPDLLNFKIRYKGEKVRGLYNLEKAYYELIGNKPTKINLGQLIKEVRLDHSLHQKELGKVIQFPPEAISRLENNLVGEYAFTVNKLKLFIQHFELDPEAFLDGKIVYTKKSERHIDPSRGILIKNIRKEFGVTQKQLASYLNTDQGFLSKMERGKFKINANHLKLISTYFGLELESLARGEIRIIGSLDSNPLDSSSSNKLKLDAIKLGRIILTLRKMFKLRQRQLAELLSYDQAVICRIEKGQCPELALNIDTLLKISDFFGLDFESLLNHEIKFKNSTNIQSEVWPIKSAA
jgi:transcriptional regulator with XRE-family HTH domain